MLSKGEVELIVVKPDLDVVTIYLFENAVIRGKKVPYRTYHMNIENVPKFEAKLRAAEASLGIRSDQSVQIIYERNQESWFSLLSILAIIGILAYFITSSAGKSGMGANMFVSFIF